MSGEDEAVSTYAQFRDEVLPRIKKQGYTAIQLMAIQVREQTANRLVGVEPWEIQQPAPVLPEKN
jgi:hypothetical protein